MPNIYYSPFSQLLQNLKCYSVWERGRQVLQKIGDIGAMWQDELECSGINFINGDVHLQRLHHFFPQFSKTKYKFRGGSCVEKPWMETNITSAFFFKAD